MEVQRSWGTLVTGCFVQLPLREAGVERIVREELACHGVTELDRYLRSVPCGMRFSDGGRGESVVLRFSDLNRAIEIELPSESLSDIQRELLRDASRQGIGNFAIEPFLTLVTPRSMSRHERISAALARAVDTARRYEFEPFLPPFEQLGPGDYQLLLRASLAARYAGVGRVTEALPLYEEVCGEGVRAGTLLKDEGRALGLHCCANVFGELFDGAIQGREKRLQAVALESLVRSLDALDSVSDQEQLLYHLNDILGDAVNTGQYRFAVGLIRSLPLRHGVRALGGLYGHLTAQVPERVLLELSQLGEELSNEFLASSTDDDRDGCVEMLEFHREVALLRIGQLDAQELGGALSSPREEGMWSGALVGALLNAGMKAEADEVARRFFAYAQEHAAHKEVRVFLAELLKTTDRGHSLALQGATSLPNGMRLSSLFGIVCAAYRCGDGESAERAFLRFIRHLPLPVAEEGPGMKEGTFHWAMLDSLTQLRKLPPNFEHRGVLFTKLFETFLPLYTGTQRDEWVMERFFQVAGEFGLIEVLGRMDSSIVLSPELKFALSIATIRSRALESHPALARKAVDHLRIALIEEAERVMTGRQTQPTLLPLEPTDARRAYLQRCAVLVQAVLEANLFPESEDLVDSLIGNITMVAPPLLPEIFSALAQRFATWEERCGAQSVIS